MLIKLLGFLDIVSAVIFFINNTVFHLLPTSIVLLVAIYLLIKGIIFVLSADFASIIDIICGIIIISSAFFILPKLIAVIIAVYLVQKGIFSMLS